jgi:hypothetical protein
MTHATNKILDNGNSCTAGIAPADAGTNRDKGARTP